MDVELFSKCDEMIISGASTYGFVAAMKSLRMPYYVNGIGFKMKKCAKMSLGKPPASYHHEHFVSTYKK